MFIWFYLFFCRPNVNEPLTWKESFDKLLSSQSKSSRSRLTETFPSFHYVWRGCQLSPPFPDGLCLFRAFLISEFSEENIAFYLACEDYKGTKSSKLAPKAKKIYDEFICSDAPREVKKKKLKNARRHSSGHSHLVLIVTLLSRYRWTSTTRPKPSPGRRWSTPDSPVSTWPNPKSTPWWRKTATLASSSPAHTWRSAEKPSPANRPDQRLS